MELFPRFLFLPCRTEALNSLLVTTAINEEVVEQAGPSQTDGGGLIKTASRLRIAHRSQTINTGHDEIRVRAIGILQGCQIASITRNQLK